MSKLIAWAVTMAWWLKSLFYFAVAVDKVPWFGHYLTWVALSYSINPLHNAERTSAQCASTMSAILGVKSFVSVHVLTPKMVDRIGACKFAAELEVGRYKAKKNGQTTTTAILMVLQWIESFFPSLTLAPCWNFNSSLQEWFLIGAWDLTTQPINSNS